MNAEDIYCKSQLGIEEVNNRKMKLSPRIRTMLILIDGCVPVMVLQKEAQKVGAAPDFIEQLQVMGLIVKSGSLKDNEKAQPTSAADDAFSRFHMAQEFMNQSIVNLLGIKAFFFTLRLERASNLNDLRELVEPYCELVSKRSSKEEADVFKQRLMGMFERNSEPTIIESAVQS